MTFDDSNFKYQRQKSTFNLSVLQGLGIYDKVITLNKQVNDETRMAPLGAQPAQGPTFITMLPMTVWSKTIAIIYIGLVRLTTGGSRTAATSKVEPFVIIANGFKPLTLITNNSTLDVAAILDLALLIPLGQLKVGRGTVNFRPRFKDI